MSNEQTPIKFVPVGNGTLATWGEHSVTVEGSADKQSITGTFAISFNGNFLPIQLFTGCGQGGRGYTTQSIPKFNFPEEFSLTANTKHFSNTEESLKFFERSHHPKCKKSRATVKSFC